MSRKPIIFEGQIEPDGAREGIQLIAPYVQGFVEAFKEAIPPNDRRWISWAKRWWIDKKHADTVEGMVRDQWAEYEIVSPDGVPTIHSKDGVATQQPNLFGG